MKSGNVNISIENTSIISGAAAKKMANEGSGENNRSESGGGSISNVIASAEKRRHSGSGIGGVSWRNVA